MRHLVLGLWAVAVVLGGCGDDTSGTGDTDAGGGKDAGPVTYGTGGEPDYAAVSAILGGPEVGKAIGSCAAVSCHGGDSHGQAGLNFKTAANVAEVLVDVPACENDTLKRVEPGDPEKSWLWIKLTGDVDNTKDGKLQLSGTPTACSGVATGFGTRMPQAPGAFDKLPKAKLDVIYDWIKGGAPGPAGPDAGKDASVADAAQSSDDAATDDAGN